MSKIEIKLINSKWLINGKPYNELVGAEKIFFDEFLLAMRNNITTKKQYVS